MDKIITLSVYENGSMKKAAAVIRGGRIEVLSAVPADTLLPVEDMENCVLLPGFADVHVHLREPGFSYKETIKSGTEASARGGFTTVCSMPNLDPVPDCAENLKKQLDIIERDALIRVCPYGAITLGEKGEKLAEMEEMAENAVAFSDDGKGVQSKDMMREAMLRAKALGKMIVAHCEDESMLRGGCIHDGEYARSHGIPGICSESEWGPIARDIALLEETGCAYHVCHISTKESVRIIREAKARGVDISCETGPHYLVFNDSQLLDSGRFRMNPPIRSAEDQSALIEGILDGTIDLIATDHAPHSAEEKSRGLRGSLNGIVGIETSFPVMYTNFVKTGLMSMEKLMELMVYNPRKRFDLPWSEGDLTIFDLGQEYSVDSGEFLSKGKSSPFEGQRVFGRCLLTAVDGNIVYNIL